MTDPEKNIHPRLRAYIEQLKDVPPRDPEAAARGRAQFLAEADSLREAVSQSSFPRHSLVKRNIQFFRRKEKMTMLPLLSSLIVAFTLLAGGAGATAYAAQDALPGDLLFPVKTLVEDAQLALTQDPVADLQLQATFTQRRVDEIATLVATGQFDNLPAAVEALNAEMQGLAEMVPAAAERDPQQMEAVRAQLEQSLQQHTQTLSILAESAPEQAQAALQMALQVSQREQTAIQEHLMQGLQEQHDGQGDQNGQNGPMEGAGQPGDGMDAQPTDNMIPPAGQPAGAPGGEHNEGGMPAGDGSMNGNGNGPMETPAPQMPAGNENGAGNGNMGAGTGEAMYTPDAANNSGMGNGMGNGAAATPTFTPTMSGGNGGAESNGGGMSGNNGGGHDDGQGGMPGGDGGQDGGGMNH